MPHNEPILDSAAVAFAEAAILAYLAACPTAADTLDGIHRWWIRWPGPEEALAVRDAALHHLEAQGQMVQVRVGSRLLWRRARSAG